MHGSPDGRKWLVVIVELIQSAESLCDEIEPRLHFALHLFIRGLTLTLEAFPCKRGKRQGGQHKVHAGLHCVLLCLSAYSIGHWAQSKLPIDTSCSVNDILSGIDEGEDVERWHAGWRHKQLPFITHNAPLRSRYTLSTGPSKSQYLPLPLLSFRWCARPFNPPLVLCL